MSPRTLKIFIRFSYLLINPEMLFGFIIGQFRIHETPLIQQPAGHGRKNCFAAQSDMIDRLAVEMFDQSGCAIFPDAAVKSGPLVQVIGRCGKVFEKVDHKFPVGLDGLSLIHISQADAVA